MRRDLDPKAITRLFSILMAGYQGQVAVGLPPVDKSAWLAVFFHVFGSLGEREGMG